MVVPLFVGREKSIAALEGGDGHKGRTTRRPSSSPRRRRRRPTTPRRRHLPFGTLGHVIQLLPLPDGTVKVLVEGEARAARRPKQLRRRPTSSSSWSRWRRSRSSRRRPSSSRRWCASVQAVFEAYVKLNKRIPPEMLMQVASIDDPARLADTIVAQLSPQAQRQAGAARDRERRQAAGEALRADAGRDRDSPGREEDPHPRQEADGEDPEGVLPERADAGHPEGAAASATSSRTRSRRSRRSSRPSG